MKKQILAIDIDGYEKKTIDKLVEWLEEKDFIVWFDEVEVDD